MNNRENIVKHYQQILTDGIQEEPPPERKGKRGREKKSKGLNLIIRMQTNMDAVLLYAFDPESSLYQ
ncbi:MAG: hypothetical protein IPO37_09635 [Saprospiraceae bacterium]|nr:hypothetical protein [Saprospiraceae bacterium]